MEGTESVICEISFGSTKKQTGKLPDKGYEKREVGVLKSHKISCIIDNNCPISTNRII